MLTAVHVLIMYACSTHSTHFLGFLGVYLWQTLHLHVKLSNLMLMADTMYQLCWTSSHSGLTSLGLF